jgi:hypothetical protein
MKNVWKLSGICRWSAVIALCGTLTTMAKAQAPVPITVPQYEVSGSYSYLRAESNQGFNLNGVSATFAHRFTDQLSVLADFGGYKFSGLPAGLNSTMYTYLFGPRFSVRKWDRVTPFGQALLGVGRLNANSGAIAAGENGFAMSIGGGADLNIRRRWAFRMIQTDYLLTRFAHTDGSSATQNDLRISTGLVFRFDVF